MTTTEIKDPNIGNYTNVPVLRDAIKLLLQAYLTAGFSLLALSAIGAQTPEVTISPSEANSCSGLEVGAGGDIQSAARSLRVDLDHGLSLMMLPGNVAVGPPYAISLNPTRNGQWSLTYAVDRGSFLPSRAFRDTVPLVAVWAQRIENVWTHAIAGAKRDSRLDCIYLDGMSYVFSVNGQRANALGGGVGIPAQLVEISDTLRIIFLDTKNTGHPIGSSIGQLSDQLNRIEGDLKISPQN